MLTTLRLLSKCISFAVFRFNIYFASTEWRQLDERRDKVDGKRKPVYRRDMRRKRVRYKGLEKRGGKRGDWKGGGKCGEKGGEEKWGVKSRRKRGIKGNGGKRLLEGRSGGEKL